MDAWRLLALLGSEGERDALFLQGGGLIDEGNARGTGTWYLFHFGQLFDKPFIGTNDRPLTTDDMKKAVRINRTAEVLMVLFTLAVSLFI